MHKQIQIAPGVYITDFRKDKNLIGLEQQHKQLTNDVGLLLDQVVALESKIQQLIYSINQIKAEQNWEKDGDFVQAVEQNWQYIVKFSSEMKEKVLRLYELQYQPQSQKIQNLLKISRIEQRQAKAIEQVKKNIANREQRRKQLMGDEGESKKLAKVDSQQQKQQGSKDQSGNNSVFV